MFAGVEAVTIAEELRKVRVPNLSAYVLGRASTGSQVAAVGIGETR